MNTTDYRTLVTVLRGMSAAEIKHLITINTWLRSTDVLYEDIL